MTKFISLQPTGLPDDFDFDLHSETPIVDIDEGKKEIVIDYVFPGFTVGDIKHQIDNETVDFVEVGISGAGFVSESGKPLLPSFGRFVQIPPGCDYKVDVDKEKPIRFEDYLITPAQENILDTEKVESEFEYDPESYSLDTLYPEDLVEVSGPFLMDDYKVLLVHVRPLQYNPAKKQLQGYGNITVKIKLKALDDDELDDSDAMPIPKPKTDLGGFGNLILNPVRRIAERISIWRYREPQVFELSGEEFLIIYDEKLKKAAQKLASWKIQKGITTKIESIDDIGNSVAKIKKYVRGKRSHLLSKLRYVLLFGDTKAIVTEQLGNTTDLYYYTSKDPSTASECVIPWISGGRIPVNSLDEANQVVDQIIRYERNPPCDAHYYNRMTFAAFFQDDDPQDGQANRAYMKTMEGIRDHMISLGFDVERVYVSNNANPQKYKDGTSVPADVRNSIISDQDATDRLISETAEGQMIAGHRDHGDHDGWSHPPFTDQDVENITSAYPTVFYSVNCLTGSFDINPQVCFAEAILMHDGGAPSLIAATELSNTWRNDSLMKCLFDALWPGVISTFPGSTASYAIKNGRIGDILNYAKAYLLVAHGTTAGVRSHYEMYHVIGDPTLEIWSQAPSVFRLRAKLAFGKLNIYVDPAPPGCVITVWHQKRLIKRSTLTSSRMSLPISEIRMGSPRISMFDNYIEVCASAPGYRFNRTRIKL